MRKALGLLVILIVLVALTGCIWLPMESPTTQPLHGVWGINPSDIFAVGASGTILHYDGGNWTPMDSGTTVGLRAVWGTSHSDVFAVGIYGYAYILHYDGSDWNVMYTCGEGSDAAWFDGVWGSSPTDVFAVGGWTFSPTSTGWVYHYDGTEWSEMAPPPGGFEFLTSVWGSSPNDVFAVAGWAEWGETFGCIYHYDGSVWTRMAAGGDVEEYLAGVWGRSHDNVFAVGENGTILHYDGSTWSPMVVNSTAWLRDIAGIWAVGEGGVILLQNSETKEWNLYQTASEYLYAIWQYKPISGLYQYYAVGNNGIIWDYPHEVPTSAVTPVELEWQDKAPGKAQVQFKNASTEDVFNVTATITSCPANVRVTDPVVTVGDIPAGESAWSKDTLTIRGVKPNLASVGKGISWRIEYDDAQGKHHVIDKHVGWRQISGIMPAE